MRLISMLSAIALAVPAVALAQAATTPAPSGDAPSPPAATSAATPEAAPAAGITAGLPVKDKTGAPIGSITEVKADAGGKQVATIKMGADTFAVDTAALAVDNGAATINATQAEIKAMLPKKN